MSTTTADVDTIDAFKREAYALIREARERHPSAVLRATVAIHPDRYRDVTLAHQRDENLRPATILSTDPGDYGLRVWGQPVVKRRGVPRDGMIVRHELDPEPEPTSTPSRGDVWRQPIPPALLTDEPLRRTYVEQVRWQARRHGYHGRVRFAVLRATPGHPFRFPDAYWIEVH